VLHDGFMFFFPLNFWAGRTVFLVRAVFCVAHSWIPCGEAAPFPAFSRLSGAKTSSFFLSPPIAFSLFPLQSVFPCTASPSCWGGRESPPFFQWDGAFLFFFFIFPKLFAVLAFPFVFQYLFVSSPFFFWLISVYLAACKTVFFFFRASPLTIAPFPPPLPNPATDYWARPPVF